jgi:glutathione S-transferase
MLVLHYVPDTASLAIRMVLEELEIAHEARLIDRDGGQLASAAYRALQPLGKIPAMETPDGPMFETAAMLLWLSDRHAPGRLAPAPDAPERAAFLSWFQFTAFNIHPTLMEIFYPDRVAGETCVPQVLDHASARMRGFLTALEGAAAAGPAWLPATGASLLGYYVAMLMRWLGTLPADHPGRVQSRDYPALHRVLAHLETRPAALSVAADEALGSTVFTAPAA